VEDETVEVEGGNGQPPPLSPRHHKGNKGLSCCVLESLVETREQALVLLAMEEPMLKSFTRNMKSMRDVLWLHELRLLGIDGQFSPGLSHIIHGLHFVQHLITYGPLRDEKGDPDLHQC